MPSTRRRPRPKRPLLLAVLALALPPAGALAQAPAAGAAKPEPAQAAAPLRLIRGTAPQRDRSRKARPSALVLEAQRADAQLGQRLQASGEVRLRHGDTLLRTEALSLEERGNEVQAPGDVQIEHLGNQVSGRALRLALDDFLGELEAPSYRIAQTGGSGRAQRLQFLGEQRLKAQDASYSSCPADEKQAPDWELRTQQLDLDLAANEGRAEGAVLRFLGVPILAAPSFSFPLGDERKSGWLPPHVGFDNRSGAELAVPYYFNLAEAYDATLTPFVMTRRGLGADGELRGLSPWGSAELQGSWLPHDRVLGQQRWLVRLGARGQPWAGARAQLSSESVSDPDYWIDLRRRIGSPTPRLLARDLQLSQQGAWRDSLHWETYARAQGWQVLQTNEAATQIVAPYQRVPQLGLRLRSQRDLGLLGGFLPSRQTPRLEGALELEYNRFALPSAALAPQRVSDLEGERLHLLAQLALPVLDPAWWLIPRLSLNSAAYRTRLPMADGRTRAQRSVPSFALDAGLAFERRTVLLERELLQTLEPRLLFVATPYRAQETLPNFDSAARDFNVESLYAANPYTGVDRVADARQLSFGGVSRWLNPLTGEEVLRLGLVQRYQFRPQRLAPDAGSGNRRFSDLLLTASAHLREPWWLDGAVQFNPDSDRSVRSVLRARYQPGPFRSASLAYRFQREQLEQLDLAWQWPLAGKAAVSASGGSCQGRWYGAGRVQYSLRERRVTDSLLGLEYDSGCWVLRMGVERLSTGLSQANTRFLLQLELVGLSRLGSNALKVLRDNVPGYRPLAGDAGPPVSP